MKRLDLLWEVRDVFDLLEEVLRNVERAHLRECIHTLNYLDAVLLEVTEGKEMVEERYGKRTEAGDGSRGGFEGHGGWVGWN